MTTNFVNDEIDHSIAVQADVFHLAAMLAHWYRELNVNPQDGEKFRQELQLNQHQTLTYNHLAIPITELFVELKRTPTMDELKVRTQAAVRNTRMASQNANRKSGKKNRSKRR